MSALTALRRRGPRVIKHAWPSVLSFGGGAGFTQDPFWLYPDDLFGWSPLSPGREKIEHSFEGYVDAAYKQNGIVFACVLARMWPFAEAPLLWQEMNDGRPGRLHASGGDLSLLSSPWPKATTQNLMLRMEQDNSLAGNSYWTPVSHNRATRRRLRRLRPDWITIISGVRDDGYDAAELDPYDLDAEVLAYAYQPRGRGVRRDYPITFLSPGSVVHYSTVPDPLAQSRGMSWLSPVLREIEGDSAATSHKLKFFEQGGTPPIVMSYDKAVDEPAFRRAVEMYEEMHGGTRNAYKALHVAGGADATVVGSDLKSIDFKNVQGAGETRIAAAAGVGAIMARFSEGMQGAGLSVGNYGQAKRQFADMTLRSLWSAAVGALAPVAPAPAGSRLWYDDSIPFLQEDAEDAAKIRQMDADAIGSLITNGFEADDAVRAVVSGDLMQLVGHHNGLPSVQQQQLEPGSGPAAGGE